MSTYTESGDRAVLTLLKVRKAFGAHKAVEGLSLSLRAGEVYTLLGPNGAGKTTTLNLILGFLQPDEGTIEVSGLNVAERTLEARARTAYLPETVMLYPTLSAIENLTYFALLAGRRIDAAEAGSLLDEAGLASSAHERRAGSFSKGMRQKVGVAIALAKRASVLLLDEPTSGLDPRAATELSSAIRAASGRGMAVLMTTHDLHRVSEVAHRLGIMNAGLLVAERDARTLSLQALEALYLEQLAA
jgi:ABC-2 type transport system ATP-binding protein